MQCIEWEALNSYQNIWKVREYKFVNISWSNDIEFSRLEEHKKSLTNKPMFICVTLKLQNLGDKSNEVTRENKWITFKKLTDGKKIFHFQQQMPEDNGVIIPEWHIHMQNFIELTSNYFSLFRARTLPTLITAYWQCIEYIIGTPKLFSEWINNWKNEWKSPQLLLV